jgi:SOS-response transcriptional repressors (RecA-mediated autopeptidases)
MKKNAFRIYPLVVFSKAAISVAAHPVHSGFPSPADDYLENRVDLNVRMVRNPDATFMVKVSGNSMTGAGIFDGDWLVVDKSLDAMDGDIVVAIVNNAFTMKRFRRRGCAVTLEAENPDFPALVFTEGDEMSIWGVVMHVIKDCRR